MKKVATMGYHSLDDDVFQMHLQCPHTNKSFVISTEHTQYITFWSILLSETRFKSYLTCFDGDVTSSSESSPGGGV